MQRWLPGWWAAAVIFVLSGGATAQAQNAGLTIYPVTIQMGPEERAAVLTIQNHADTATTFQIRAFSWSQQNGAEQLVPTDALLVSPPLGTIAAGNDQVVRLVLRQPAQAREAAFRILFDQILPPPKPGSVNFALRLSIPVFAEPPSRAVPHLRWSVEHSFLVAVNDGGSHEAVRNIKVSTAAGHTLRLEQNVSPYVLPGATHRWRILDPEVHAESAAFRLKADVDSGAIDQAVIMRNGLP